MPANAPLSPPRGAGPGKSRATRSLSARIFRGFLLVIAAFAMMMSYTIYRMYEVSNELRLINKVYLPLALTLGEFYTIQGRVQTVIADRAAGKTTSAFVRRQVALARQYRLRDLRLALQLVRDGPGAAASVSHASFLAQMRRQLSDLLKRVVANESPLARLFAKPATPAELHRVGADLLRNERALERLTRRMRNRVRGRVRAARVSVARDQRYSMWIGLTLVGLAVAVGGLVSYRARKILRPLSVLVEGTKRIGTGDYGGRLTVDSRDELGLLAEAFNNMSTALEERELRLLRSERMAAAGRLASHITHEVRNPLNSISLNTEMLEEEINAVSAPNKGASEATALCQAIRREVDRLTGITEEYLRFARLPKPELREEDLDPLLRNIVDFVRPEFEQAGLELQLLPMQPLPLVCIDEGQIRQVFGNLLRNAREAMHGDGAGRLTIRTQVRGAHVEVDFSDTGPGVPAEDLDRIFEPFFSMKAHGTGLGLALTQQILNEHHGFIKVESLPQSGTTFTVGLPVRQGSV